MSPAPRYEMINRDLSHQISTGALKPGHRLESEAKLAAHYGVSRMTVRQALDELQSDGHIIRRQGAGTFVAQPKPLERRASLGAFHEEMGLDAGTIETVILAQEVGTPPEHIAKLLAPASGQTSLRIERLRLLDSRPISLQESWIPYLLAPSLARNGLIGGSLYRALSEGAGIEIRSADQQVKAAQATSRQAQLLKVAQGSPLLEIFRSSFTGSGDPVEVAHSFTLPIFPLSMHLER